MSIANFEDWKQAKETLSDIPLFLDQRFIQAIMNAISICDQNMNKLDPEGYENYMKLKIKELKMQTKLAFGDQHD